MASMDVTVTNQIKLRFNWSQASQNVSNNNSVVSWSLQLISTTGTISSSAKKSWSVTVNGSKYSGTNTIGISTNTTKTLASGSTTIAHNSDGTKTFSFSFSQQFDINYSGVGWIGTKSGSGSGTLSTIPRTSSVSSTNANIGENINITISRASGSFTHTLKYVFHNLSGTIATKTGSTSVSWTLPTTFYAQIPNAKSSWGRVICETYNGSTLIGSSECRFDVYVKESTNKPGITATVEDIDTTTLALTGDKNKLIKYYSNVRFNIDSTPKNSASTKSINITYLGNGFTGGSGNHWAAEFSNVISGYYRCSVTDTRGFTTSVDVHKTLIEYVKITCAMTVSNPTASGDCTLTITGNYFNGTFGKTNNTLTVQYKKNDGSWTNTTATLSGNTYKATVSLTGLDYTQAYTFQARATDKLATATTDSQTVKSTPIFDWGSDDFHFHVPAYINGQAIFHEGNTNGPVAGNWFSGGMTRVGTDGVMEIGAYVDFHNTNTTASDYSTRLSANGDNQNVVYLPTGNGTLCLSNQVIGNSGSQTLNVAGGKFTITGNGGYGHLDVAGGFHTRGDSQDIWYERHIMPASWSNAALYLGYSDKRWKAVYSANGTIQTSDERFKVKQGFTDIEECYEMIKDTDIYNYIMLSQNKEDLSKNRLGKLALSSSQEQVNIHMGIMAQDIQKYKCSKQILVEGEYERADGSRDTMLSVNPYGLTTAIMGALKVEIQKRELLEEKITKLESLVEQLMTQSVK